MSPVQIPAAMTTNSASQRHHAMRSSPGLVNIVRGIAPSEFAHSHEKKADLLIDKSADSQAEAVGYQNVPRRSRAAYPAAWQLWQQAIEPALCASARRDPRRAAESEPPSVRAGEGGGWGSLNRLEYPQGESNPCFRTENPESWATRRWGPMATGHSSQFPGGLSRRRAASLLTRYIAIVNVNDSQI